MMKRTLNYLKSRRVMAHGLELLILAVLTMAAIRAGHELDRRPTILSFLKIIDTAK